MQAIEYSGRETGQFPVYSIANSLIQGTATQNTGVGDAGKELKRGQEKLVTSRFQDVGITSNVRRATREAVSREAFDVIIREFGEHTNVIAR